MDFTPNCSPFFSHAGTFVIGTLRSNRAPRLTGCGVSVIHRPARLGLEHVCEVVGHERLEVGQIVAVVPRNRAATQPRAEESAATTIDSGTSRSRACSAATWTSASVRRLPACTSSAGSGAECGGGGGGVFTGDSVSVTRFRVQASGVTLFFLPERQLLGSHHSDHRGRRQPRLGGNEPHLDAGYSLHGWNYFCKRKAPCAKTRGGIVAHERTLAVARGNLKRLKCPSPKRPSSPTPFSLLP